MQFGGRWSPAASYCFSWLLSSVLRVGTALPGALILRHPRKAPHKLSLAWEHRINKTPFHLRAQQKTGDSYNESEHRLMLGLPFKRNAPATCRDHGGPRQGHSQLHYYLAIDLFLAGSHTAASAAICLTEKLIAKCKQRGNWSLISLIAWRNRRGRLTQVEPITSTGSAKFFSVTTGIILL